MKKILLLLVVSLLAIGRMMAQDANDGMQQPVNLVLPGNGNIDVEKLNGDIDLNMDVSKLNLYEIRVLKAAFGARQGELIMISELRRLFDATSWYTEIAEKRAGLHWNDKTGNFDPCTLPPISYTPDEQAFLKKLDEAEKNLIANNLITTGTKSHPQKGPNLANLANPMQMLKMPKALENMLSNNGFAIVPDEKEQLFHIYENNDYHEFPSFVTTDLYLQTYHMYFDYMLRKMGMTFQGDARIYAGFHIRNPRGIVLGNGVSIGPKVLLDGRKGLTIEEGAVIGYGAIIWTLNHDYNDIHFCGKGAPVTIGRRAWICSNSIILPGITIGEGAVVASGAVVTHDVEPFTIVGGVPAKVIGKRAEKEYDYLYRADKDNLHFC